MGHVAAPFGIQGWIKVQAYTEMLDGLLDYPVWWLGNKDSWREYRVLEAAPHGKTLIAKLEGCSGREMAQNLKGCQIAVPRTALPVASDDEYYWADLIGLSVVNIEGVPFGQVSSLLETGANDVLVVQGERERLIPFVAAVIRKVDIAARLIQVDWGADY